MSPQQLHEISIQAQSIARDLALTLRAGRATQIVMHDERGPVASVGASAEALQRLADRLDAISREDSDDREGTP